MRVERKFKKVNKRGIAERLSKMKFKNLLSKQIVKRLGDNVGGES